MPITLSNLPRWLHNHGSGSHSDSEGTGDPSTILGLNKGHLSALSYGYGDSVGNRWVRSGSGNLNRGISGIAA